MADGSRTTTLIIHGTFAEDESWWRLGEDGRTTFADELARALGDRGNTVWRPALEAGLSYSDFAWSGANRHRDRVRGGRKLARSLERLADRLGVSTETPLTVNLVAHSHGGNVVLEALKRLPDTVRLGRVVLLGTPLLTTQPAFRLFRLVLSAVLVALLALFALFTLLWLVSLTGAFALPDAAADGDGVSPVALVLLTVPILAGYAWVFAGISALADVLWAIVATVLVPRRLLVTLATVAVAQVGALAATGRLLDWWLVAAGVLLAAVVLWTVERVRRRDRGAYGPPPRALRALLGGRPIVLLTSRHDEADLLLKLGAAPRKLYREKMNALTSRLARMGERLFLRPVALHLLLRVLETVLERVVLGFGWLGTLLVDYEMADLTATTAYARGTILERIDVTEQLHAKERVRRESRALPPPIVEAELDSEALEGMERHKETLSRAIEEVMAYLKRQLVLRHSLYYESSEVVGRVGALLM